MKPFIQCHGWDWFVFRFFAELTLQVHASGKTTRVSIDKYPLEGLDEKVKDVEAIVAIYAL